MAEPFARPNRKELKKAIGIYSDPLLHWATNAAIGTLNKLNPENIDFKESQFREWEFLTRRMLWKFGTSQVVNNVFKLSEESAEEYWKDWKPPILTKEKTKMISGDWKSG